MYFFNIEKPSTVTFFRNVHCTLMHVSHIQWNYFFRNLISFCFHLPKRPESDIISTSLSLIVCWSLTQCHSFRNRSPKWLGDRFIFLFHLMLQKDFVRVSAWKNTRHRFNNKNCVVCFLISSWFMVSVLCRRNNWLAYLNSFYYYLMHYTNWNMF